MDSIANSSAGGGVQILLPGASTLTPIPTSFTSIGGADTLLPPVSTGPVDAPSAIPLTTPFTPPSKCRAPSAYLELGNATSIEYDTSCYPESWELFQKTSNKYYSPGICPLSYLWPTVSVVAKGLADGAPVTQALCCPSGLSKLGYNQYTTYCYDVATLGAGTRGRFALPISVAWGEEDLKSFRPTSAPLIALRSAGWRIPDPSSETSDPPTSSSTSASSPTRTPSPPNGLSVAAAVGIGVGVGVPVIAALVGLLWYFHRLRRSRQHSEANRGVTVLEGTGEPSNAAEKDGKERFELSSTGKPAEAEDKGIVELDSGWQAAEAEGSGPHDRRTVVQ